MSAPVSKLLPAAGAVCARCGHDGASHHHADIACAELRHGGTACWAHMPRGVRADGTPGPVSLCECPAFVDGFTQLMAPVLALREEPHDSPLRHEYRLGRDLPKGGA